MPSCRFLCLGSYQDIGILVDKFLTDEEVLLRTLDTNDSVEKTDVIADPDGNNLFPP